MCSVLGPAGARRRVPRAVVLVVALTAAACGTTNVATPPPTATSAPRSPAISATPPAAATETPTLPPSNPAIVPVPTPSFSAPSSGPVLEPATAARLQEILDDWRSKSGIPGMSAAVLFPDGDLWTGASGAAVRGGAAAEGTTVYSVGSITKTFVSAMILRLSERGALSLDDRLTRWVPSFPNAAGITVRQLLNHTSGIQDLFSNTKIAEAILANPARIWTPADVLALIGKPYFPPGKGYHYSNTNYLLLGLIVEKATGKTLAAAIRSEFLAPLGLAHTFMQAQERPSGLLAHGYMGTAKAPRDVSAGSTLLPFNSEVTAAGGSGELAATAPDLARWAAALYGGGVLDEATMASMVDVSGTSPFHPHYEYGLGFEEWTLGGRMAWGHRGHLDGFWSSMAYLPAEHISIVVLANAEWADTLTPTSSMMSSILGPVPVPTPSARPAASATPAASQP